jgi:hypothetical protein
LANDELRSENIRLQDKLHEMLAVMREAAHADQDEIDQKVNLFSSIYNYYIVYTTCTV